MAGLAFADIDDAVLTTQQALVKRGAFVGLQTDLTDFVAIREMWKSKQKKFIGGHPWKWHAQIDQNHSARSVGLFETDGSAIVDTMISLKVEPKHVNAHYVYDLREPDFQRGGHAIVDLVKTRYIAMMVSFYEYLETVLWTKPASTADVRTPYGIEYWVTQGAAGFNGVDPIFDDATTEARGGVSSAAVSRWANYTDNYVAISKEDLIRKMRKAHRQIQFRSPVSHAEPTIGGMKNGVYCGDTVIGLMEEILEDQNMNLGNDLASKDGRTLFKSTPVTYAPKVDADAKNPIYMLDWKWLAIGVMPGWENELGKPYMVPNKSKVRRVDLDATLQMVCTDLRRQAVLALAG